MNKYLIITVGGLLVGCGQPKQQLNVFFPPDYIDPEVVADFEREFDCKVTFDFFEDPNVLAAKLAAGGSSTYDIVDASNFHLSPSQVMARLEYGYDLGEKNKLFDEIWTQIKAK